MRGTSATTGQALEGVAHLRQSVRDILTTPLGSRVMRRDYGSRLFELGDAPLHEDTLLDLYAATAEALARWEPRLRVRRVTAVAGGTGRVEITIEANYLPDGRPIVLDGIQLN